MNTFLLINFLCVTGRQAWWTELDVTGVQNANGGLLKTELKVTRFNRTTYTLSGNFEITENIGMNYDCEARTYGSRQGNNQLTLLPYKLPRSNCCQFSEAFYFRFFEKLLAAHSNLPKREKNTLLCNTYKKGVYRLEHEPIDKNMVVKYVEPGTYKGELMFYKKTSSETSSVISVIIKLY